MWVWITASGLIMAAVAGILIYRKFFRDHDLRLKPYTCAYVDQARAASILKTQFSAFWSSEGMPQELLDEYFDRALPNFLLNIDVQCEEDSSTEVIEKASRTSIVYDWYAAGLQSNKIAFKLDARIMAQAAMLVQLAGDAFSLHMLSSLARADFTEKPIELLLRLIESYGGFKFVDGYIKGLRKGSNG